MGSEGGVRGRTEGGGREEEGGGKDKMEMENR